LKRKQQKVDQVVAYLAREMGVRWEGFEHLGSRPDQWPLRLAISEVEKIDHSKINSLYKAHEEEFLKLAARSSQMATFAGLETQVAKLLS
jgi:hypothetical protein